MSRFPAVSVFNTPMGWFALLGTEAGLRRIVFGHPTAKAAREAIGDHPASCTERDWHPGLRQQCEIFASGQQAVFPNVAIDRQRPLTMFQERVIEIVRAIPPGETLTYAQVATLAGSPGAARAVGTVMSSNPVPLVVPCHRVVGASGSLGGFSAPGGVKTKRSMLDREAVGCGHSC